jgi:hypothetical protein
MTDPQVLQTAINGAANAHTGLHQAIQEQEYEVIKQDYWAELSSEETELIKSLEIASQPPVIQVGSIVAYADPYYTLYNARGEVVEDLGEE